MDCLFLTLAMMVMIIGLIGLVFGIYSLYILVIKKDNQEKNTVINPWFFKKQVEIMSFLLVMFIIFGLGLITLPIVVVFCALIEKIIDYFFQKG